MFNAFLVLTALAGLTPTTADDNFRLVPQPNTYKVGNTVTCLSSKFLVSYDGPSSPDLQDASNRLVHNVFASNMRYLSPDYGAEFFPDGVNCTETIDELKIKITSNSSIAENAILPVEKRVEAETYKLSVPTSGVATITADTALGAFRGLTSFENLFYTIGKDSNVDLYPYTTDLKARCQNAVYAPFAPYEIEDKPQFPWRSVLFDTSRNYFRIKTIKKLLDTMSRVKLNVFHWHITDSQSWPLSLKSLPELAEKGAYQTRIYSEDDVKDIVAFAAERGIDVVIEIDTPGHTASIWHSHPDYIACYGAEPWKLSANEPPAGQLRFANDTVVEFTQKVFSNVLELIQSPYLGTGGDEINLDCMNNDTVTSATLEEKNITLQTALAEFTTKTHQTILDSNRAPMVWEEMVLAHGKLDLNENTIIDLWKEAATGGPSVVAAAGFRMVRADYDYLYLDCGRGGWVGFEGGLNSWCDPFKTWHHAYSFNPYSNLTEADYDKVLGGQASVWAEQIDETNYEGVIWPRAAAVAELLWTGSANTVNNTFPRSSLEAFPRMNDIRYRLVDGGINAIPLQPEWCALRPHKCDYV